MSNGESIESGKNKPEQKRLNVVIDKSVYKNMKEHCVKNDISISEITRKLWMEYMEKNQITS